MVTHVLTMEITTTLHLLSKAINQLVKISKDIVTISVLQIFTKIVLCTRSMLKKHIILREKEKQIMLI